jgi:hypothetical protein
MTPSVPSRRTSLLILEVPQQLQRSRTKDEKAAQESAIALLEVLAAEIGRPDLDGVSVLDVGCGVKFPRRC